MNTPNDEHELWCDECDQLIDGDLVEGVIVLPDDSFAGLRNADSTLICKSCHIYINSGE